jgi:hypothetical protein
MEKEQVYYIKSNGSSNILAALFEILRVQLQICEHLMVVRGEEKHFHWHIEGEKREQQLMKLQLIGLQPKSDFFRCGRR